MDNNTDAYVEMLPCGHREALGQYFTPTYIAEFMADWVVGKRPKTILDPAVGNNIFFRTIGKIYNECNMIGYESDEHIFRFFSLGQFNIFLADFLTSSWDNQYDAIIANPPFSKFQKIKDRAELIDLCFKHTNIRLAGLSNYCLYFFLKCLYQLKDGGRLAFIMPYDFLDGPQGNTIKHFLLYHNFEISIHFLKYENIFSDDIITTAAIFLIEKSTSHRITFLEYYSERDFRINHPTNSRTLSCIEVESLDKWSNFSFFTKIPQNVVPYHTYLTAKRGIATGCNEFFLLCDEAIKNYHIPYECIKYCISSSSFYKTPFLTNETIIAQEKKNKLLILNAQNSNLAKDYIAWGVSQGYNQRYLTANRKIWYELGVQTPPQILMACTTRNKINFIFNESDCLYMTSYHGLYVKKPWLQYIKVLFCFMQTCFAQNLLRLQSRDIGHGLIKMQPNDLNSALVINVEVLERNDIKIIEEIFDEAHNNKFFSEQEILKLEMIFKMYLY